MFSNLQRHITKAIVCIFIGISPNVYALTISGRITSEGVPVRSVTVYCSDVAKRALTNKDGVYTITVPKAGTYTVSPFLRRKYIPNPLTKNVAVEAANVTAVDFELTKLNTELGGIAGRITGLKSTPLEGVQVRISKDVSTHTDKNGIFYFKDLQVGRYLVVPYAEQYTFSTSYREVKLRKGATYSTKLRGLKKDATDTYSTYYPGRWNFTANLSKNTCQNFNLTSLSGDSLVRQKRSTIYLRLPTLGQFKGSAGANSFSLNIKTSKYLCKITGTLDGTFQNSISADLIGKWHIECPFFAPCDVEFTSMFNREG